jgi:DUF2975 family protein
METYRPDPMVKTLGALVSFAYFAMMAMTVLVLAGAPAVKLLAGDSPKWSWGLEVPAPVPDIPTTVRTSWGPAKLEVEDVRAKLRLPIGMIPWPLMVVLWLHAGAGGGLIVLSLYQLRRIFQRVRDGAPFDADNARRLRWLGMSMLALALLNGVAELVTTLAVKRGLPDTSGTMPVGLRLDGLFVFAALVLIALARIFRRGSDLEHDQSLVI